MVTFIRGCTNPGAFLILLLAWGITLPAAKGQGLRIVDLVTVGDPASEREHEYAGEQVITKLADGKTFRQAHGRLSYSMAVFEDSEVALNCTFRGTEGRKLFFDLLVEGRNIATHAFVSPTTTPVTVEYHVPIAVTCGLTGIRVALQAVDGPTPGLLELRIVQEHLEQASAYVNSKVSTWPSYDAGILGTGSYFRSYLPTSRNAQIENRSPSRIPAPAFW